MDERIFYKKNEKNISRIQKKNKKSSFNFKEKKNNTIKSLNEVEIFLNDFKNFKKYLHLYKFFKK